MRNVCSDANSTVSSVPVNATNVTDLYVFVLGSFVSLNYTLPTLIIVAAILFIVIILTAFGNLLVVLALFKYRSLRTISNYLIGNLAISDFLLATTVLPLSTFNECLGHWILGRFLCNAWLIMDVLYCTASIWNILFIAFDRFTATLYPIWYRENQSTQKAVIYIALVWLISCAICFPPVLGWNDVSQNYVPEENMTDIYKCVLFESPSYVLYSACGSFYIPFFATFFFYMGIFIALRERMLKTKRSAMKMAARTRSGSAHLQQQPSKKPAKEKKGKAHAVEKGQPRVEVVSKEVGKENIVADENSSKSLFGSDSDREKSISEVEIDATTTVSVAMTTIVTSDAMTTTGAVTSDDKATAHDDAVPSNGFARVTSQHAHDNPAKTVAEAGASPARRNGQQQSKRGGGSKSERGNIKAAAHQKPAAGAGPPVDVAAKARHAPPAAKSHAAKQNRRYEQREMRATIRMAIIIAFFCGMWVGFFTTYVLRSWCTGCHIPRELEAFFFWLGYSNSSINPILYTIFNDDFRKAFMQILGCQAMLRKTKR